MTFDEWLPTLSHDDKYNFGSEGRGYKKDAVTMMRVAFEAGRVAEREEIANWIKSTDMSRVPREQAYWLSNLLNTYAEAIRARGDTK